MAIIQNKPNMNYGVWGSNGNIAVPTSEKVDLGWIIEKPPNEMMNWVQNRQDSMLQFINQRGIPTWDSLTEYPLNAYVVRNGSLYRAVSQNIDKDPTLNQSIWTVAFASQIDFTNLYNDVQRVKGEDGYLSQYVSKASPVMTADAKGVGYKDSTGVSGLTFDGTTPQIEKDGEVVATFSNQQKLSDVLTRGEFLELIQIKVGAIYLTTIADNPKITLGYGTWEKYAKGMALVGHSDDPSSSTPDWVKFGGNTSGNYSNTLSVDNMPKHTHTQNDVYGNTTYFMGGFGEKTGQTVNTVDSAQYTASGTGVETTSAGNSLPVNNVQPSIVIYVWKRLS